MRDHPDIAGDLRPAGFGESRCRKVDSSARAGELDSSTIGCRNGVSLRSREQLHIDFISRSCPRPDGTTALQIGAVVKGDVAESRAHASVVDAPQPFLIRARLAIASPHDGICDGLAGGVGDAAIKIDIHLLELLANDFGGGSDRLQLVLLTAARRGRAGRDS